MSSAPSKKQPDLEAFMPEVQNLSSHTKAVLSRFGFSSLPSTEAKFRQLLMKIKSANDDLPAAPTPPSHPKIIPTASLSTNVSRIQNYIEGFEYNHTDRPSYYDVKKTQGLSRILRTSKEIMSHGLPIKCIEAVFLGVYLTNILENVMRLPIAFRSEIEGHFFEHIVLGIRSEKTSKWGAIGLSRKDTLMFKPLKYDSLGDMLNDYKTAYEDCFHSLKYVYLGLPFGRNLHSTEEIEWRVLKLDANKWPMLVQGANSFANDIAGISELHKSTGKIPPEVLKKYGHIQRFQGGSPKRQSPSKKKVSNSSSQSPKKKKKKKKKASKKLAAAVWAPSRTDTGSFFEAAPTTTANVAACSSCSSRD